MSKPWPRVKLGEVVAHRKKFVTIDDLTTYKRCRVQLHAKGVVLRDLAPGMAVKTKKQQVCDAGELLVAEIDAKHGGYGIVPDDLQGAIVSSHYFLFTILASRLDRGFLGYYLRTPEFRVQVEAQGSTNYAAIRPDHVLGYEIPLPPLDEQRRIVAYLDTLSAKITQARTLRQQLNVRVDQTLQSVFNRVSDGAPCRPMSELAPLVRRPVDVDATASYPELGIRSFGKGTFHKPAVSGIELGTKRIFWIEPGDLLFSNVFGWEGAIAVSEPHDCNRVGSHRFITRKVDPNLATASFLCFYFLTPDGLEKIRAASPGGAGRNRTLGLEALDAITAPAPSVSLQKHFDELKSKFSFMRHHQEAADLEINALLPAVLDRAFKGEL